jgi:hypothetical protein
VAWLDSLRIGLEGNELLKIDTEFVLICRQDYILTRHGLPNWNTAFELIGGPNVRLPVVKDRRSPVDVLDTKGSLNNK